MQVNEIRDIFSRFQNLNLLFLIEDLRRGRVVFEDWWCQWKRTEQIDFCPLSHGASGSVIDISQYSCAAKLTGVSTEFCEQFANWWDDGSSHKKRRRLHLLKILQSIYAERLADADAVQSVLDLPAPVRRLACVERVFDPETRLAK